MRRSRSADGGGLVAFVADCRVERGVFRYGGRKSVEADGGGLAEVHGEVAASSGVHGDGEEGVAEAQLVVGEAGFFGAEEDGDPVCRRFGGG